MLWEIKSGWLVRMPVPRNAVLWILVLGILVPCVLVQVGMAQDSVFPKSLQRFDAYARNPVFQGRSGQWDAKIRERGWIMRIGERYMMWYTGYNDAQTPVIMKLGVATSTDGLVWQRHGDPVYDREWVEDMMVVRHDGRFYMFAEGAGDQSQLLVSDNGFDWKRVGTLDVRLTSGEPIPPGPFGTPTAWYEDGTWYLFYERRDQGVWLATSTDMIVWTNVSDAPLIVPGPRQYDKLMIAMNQVIKVNGRYYAVLHGTGSPQKPRDWCTYTAVSDDLRHWSKNPDGPLLPIRDNRSSGQFVHDGTSYRLYTMHARADVYFAAP